MGIAASQMPLFYLGTVTWLAGSFVKSTILTREDKVLILNQIGKPALQSIDDKILSDACWLYFYAF